MRLWVDIYQENKSKVCEVTYNNVASHEIRKLTNEEYFTLVYEEMAKNIISKDDFEKIKSFLYTDRNGEYLILTFTDGSKKILRNSNVIHRFTTGEVSI